MPSIVGISTPNILRNTSPYGIFKLSPVTPPTLAHNVRNKGNVPMAAVLEHTVMPMDSERSPLEKYENALDVVPPGAHPIKMRTSVLLGDILRIFPIARAKAGLCAMWVRRGCVREGVCNVYVRGCVQCACERVL
jgi:hypothetical protein